MWNFDDGTKIDSEANIHGIPFDETFHWSHNVKQILVLEEKLKDF